jgi:peptide/nickel transport system substrate-binding protein
VLVTQDQLGQIGLEAEVVSMEWGAFLNDVLLPQKFNASVVGFGGGSEVDGIAYNIMHSKNDVPGSGFNADSYVNPEVDKLLDEGRSMVGCKLEDRAPIYYEIQRIAREDVAYGFTVGTNQVHVMNARLLNYDPGPWNTYNHIELWELAK